MSFPFYCVIRTTNIYIGESFLSNQLREMHYTLRDYTIYSSLAAKKKKRKYKLWVKRKTLCVNTDIEHFSMLFYIVKFWWMINILYIYIYKLDIVDLVLSNMIPPFDIFKNETPDKDTCRFNSTGVLTSDLAQEDSERI